MNNRFRLPGEIILIVALGVLGWWLQGALSDLAVAKALANDRAEEQEAVQELLNDAGNRARADSLELEQLRDSLRIERTLARDTIAQGERDEAEATARAAQAGVDLDATLDSLAVVVPVELRPLVAVAQSQHGDEQSAQKDVRDAFRAQLRGAARFRIADSAEIVKLGAALESERSEKALLLESNLLYEEEVGFLRDALPGGLFGHIGSFMRGLGAGVALGAFIAKR